MFQVLEYIKIAIRNIASSKGRSFLTMLGIIIGIASVIMIITIGNAVSGTVSGELDTLGGGMIEIVVNSSEADANVSFNQEDIDFLMNKVDHIKGATPVTTCVRIMVNTLVSMKIAIGRICPVVSMRERNTTVL